ncbi:hypothetical protein J6590_003421 [Homalodisca vitripennis]|nr:hypothetical protein J6590_003421 [Homalodisca vitripennis]
MEKRRNYFWRLGNLGNSFRERASLPIMRAVPSNKPRNWKWDWNQYLVRGNGYSGSRSRGGRRDHNLLGYICYVYNSIEEMKGRVY